MGCAASTPQQNSASSTKYKAAPKEKTADNSVAPTHSSTPAAATPAADEDTTTVAPTATTTTTTTTPTEPTEPPPAADSPPNEVTTTPVEEMATELSAEVTAEETEGELAKEEDTAPDTAVVPFEASVSWGALFSEDAVRVVHEALCALSPELQNYSAKEGSTLLAEEEERREAAGKEVERCVEEGKLVVPEGERLGAVRYGLQDATVSELLGKICAGQSSGVVAVVSPPMVELVQPQGVLLLVIEELVRATAWLGLEGGGITEERVAAAVGALKCAEGGGEGEVRLDVVGEGGQYSCREVAARFDWGVEGAAEAVRAVQGAVLSFVVTLAKEMSEQRLVVVVGDEGMLQYVDAGTRAELTCDPDYIGATAITKRLQAFAKSTFSASEPPGDAELFEALKRTLESELGGPEQEQGTAEPQDS